MNKDREHEIKAIELLDNCLFSIKSFPEESGIDKEELLDMYMNSRNIIKRNVDNFELNRAAESVCSTCIRVVRCSGIVGEEAKTLLINPINPKKQSPEVGMLYKHAIRLYEEMKKLDEKC